MFAKIRDLVKKNIFKSQYLPGHYYSTIPNSDYIEENAARIFQVADEIPGIELHAYKQLDLAKSFHKFTNEMPFMPEQNSKNRYYFKNEYFIKPDGLALYYVLRHFSPKKIVEVGSGFSSVLMMDVKDQFIPETKLTFIEPYPDRLYSLFKLKDKEQNNVIVDFIQNIDHSVFDALEENDILFIDSSHVSKAGSDVNHIFFSVFPRLKPGVIIHLHDVLYPFEYPIEWIMKGIHWNEAYLLKTFLMYNNSFEILWFNSFLKKKHDLALAKVLPIFDAPESGGSIYIRKIR